MNETKAIQARTYQPADRTTRAHAWFDGADDESGRLWASLAAQGEDIEASDPVCGECWQYMGTWRTAAGWVHQFRHRHHPRLGRRVYRDIPVAGEALAWLQANDRLADAERQARERHARRQRSTWQSDADYGGAFDGTRVTSDADLGL